LPPVHKTVGVVVPTLGDRPLYLSQALQSLFDSGAGAVVVVSPRKLDLPGHIGSDSRLIEARDPGRGLAAAINAGFQSIPESCEFVTWLGDDDVLTKESIGCSSATLSSRTDAVAVFGACDYIDEDSKVFWTNRFGRMAVPLMFFGPNKVPQPGSLVRRNALKKIGWLDESLGWAFDQDMFMRLVKVGKIVYVPEVLARFRWHAGSLSAGYSNSSLLEASNVRKKNAIRGTGWLIKMTEALHVRLATKLGGSLDRRKLGG
jgi:GT2 family glycosyltransferase